MTLTSDSDSDSSSTVRTLALLAAGYVGFIELTGGSYPDLPAWSGVATAGAVLIGIAALFATGKIDDLLPDPRSIRIVQINANGEELAAWKLSPDKFEETEIKWGPLFPHADGKFQTYEAYAFDPGTNVAVGTWRRSMPGSELVGQFDIEDVLSVIADYRGRLEPDARRVEAMKASLPSIIRELEFHRAEMQSSALDPSSPMKMDSPTIDETIRQHLPEELQPGHIRQGDLATLLDAPTDDGDGWDGEGFDLVIGDDAPTDALEPVGEAMNDGGEIQ